MWLFFVGLGEEFGEGIILFYLEEIFKHSYLYILSPMVFEDNGVLRKLLLLYTLSCTFATNTIVFSFVPQTQIAMWKCMCFMESWFCS